MELKTKIQNLRKMKQLSQEKLAECLGISRQAIAKWENGESFPDINNLIQISNLFNITIDRLLKEDNCIDAIIHDNQKENDEIIPFLISAKKSTYAGSAEEQAKSTRPKSHDLIYENGHYQYIDTYLGGERFIGEEAVFVDGNPVWAMNYNGNEINEKFSANFLKQALSHVTLDRPYRGPAIFQAGDYTYTCQVIGNFDDFYGTETMYFQEECIYECRFSGGRVK